MDYTVKAVVAVGSNGERYYDHKLTQIEKGALLSTIPNVAKSGEESTTPLSAIKDKRLLSVLQVDSSKIVDENGEPMVVYHGTSDYGFTRFSAANSDDERSLFFSSERSVAETYSDGSPKFDDKLVVGEDFLLAEKGKAIAKSFLPDITFGHMAFVVRKTQGGLTKQENIFVPDGKSLEEELSEKTGIDVQTISENLKGASIGKDDKVFVRSGSGRVLVDYEFLPLLRAKMYSPGVYPVFLNIRNPLSIDGKETSWQNVGGSGKTTRELSKEAFANGQDGVAIKRISDVGVFAKNRRVMSDIFIAFHGRQIKSATQNVGTYSRTNDDIRYSRSSKPQSVPRQVRNNIVEESRKRWEKSGAKRSYNGVVEHGTEVLLAAMLKRGPDMNSGRKGPDRSMEYAKKLFPWEEEYVLKDMIEVAKAAEAEISKAKLNVARQLTGSTLEIYRKIREGAKRDELAEARSAVRRALKAYDRANYSARDFARAEAYMAKRREIWSIGSTMS